MYGKSDTACEQQKAEPCQEAPKIVAHGGEHSVDGVAGRAGEVIAVHTVLVCGVADDRFDGRSAPHLALDRLGHAAFLALIIRVAVIDLRVCVSPSLWRFAFLKQFVKMFDEIQSAYFKIGEMRMDRIRVDHPEGIQNAQQEQL